MGVNRIHFSFDYRNAHPFFDAVLSSEKPTLIARSRRGQRDPRSASRPASGSRLRREEFRGLVGREVTRGLGCSLPSSDCRTCHCRNDRTWLVVYLLHFRASWQPRSANVIWTVSAGSTQARSAPPLAVAYRATRNRRDGDGSPDFARLRQRLDRSSALERAARYRRKKSAGGGWRIPSDDRCANPLPHRRSGAL